MSELEIIQLEYLTKCSKGVLIQLWGDIELPEKYHKYTSCMEKQENYKRLKCFTGILVRAERRENKEKKKDNYQHNQVIELFWGES